MISVCSGKDDLAAMPDARSRAAKRVGDGHCQILLFRANELTPGAKRRRRRANGSKTGNSPEKAVASPRKVRLHSLPSATGGIARLVAARLNAAKIPSQPLLAKAGVTTAQVEDPVARIAVQGQIK